MNGTDSHARSPALALLLLGALLASGCATYTSVREHPRFVSQEREIKRVAMLPAEVEFVYMVFTGDNQRMPEKEREIAQELSTSVPYYFSRQGYELSDVDLKQQIEASPELAYELEQLRRAYTTASEELYGDGAVTEEEHDDFQVTVGPVVNQFADLAEADGLILVRYSGFEKSKGLMTKEVAGNVLLAALTGSYYQPLRTGGGVEVALIDGDTGDVLWSNVGGAVTSPEATELVMAALPGAQRNPVEETPQLASGEAELPSKEE